VFVGRNHVNQKKPNFLTPQFRGFFVKEIMEFRRRQKNPTLPVSALCRYSSLQYFHQELGLNN
jgi:hypothetical protein